MVFCAEFFLIARQLPGLPLRTGLETPHLGLKLSSSSTLMILSIESVE